MSIRTALPKLRPSKIGWGAAAGWLGAFISFPIGGFDAEALIGAVDNMADGLIAGAAVGLVIGVGQWLVLRRTYGINRWWIAATTLGMAVGLSLAVALFGSGTSLDQIVARALVTGSILGLAQGVVLSRRLSIVALWTLVVTGTFTLSWIVSSRVIINSLSNGYAIFGASGAILFQLITGLVILFALPKPVDAAPAPLSLEK
jgi:hypothetical protein